MKVRGAVFFAVGIAALGVVQASPVAADPKGGDLLELDCDQLGTVEVVVFSNGSASPGLVVGSNQVVIPYALHIEGTFTPVDGEPESFVDDFTRPAPRNGRTDHCTFHDEGSDEFGSFVIDGDVSVSYTPAR